MVSWTNVAMVVQTAENKNLLQERFSIESKVVNDSTEQRNIL